MSKGGSQTTTMSIPSWLEQPTRRNIQRAEEISQIGYIPRMGPEVAAFTSPQYQAMANNNRMAQAYGLETKPIDVPDAQEFAGGLEGYSSYAPFEEMIRQIRDRRPHQYTAHQGQFLNPWTGKAPSSWTAANSSQTRNPQGNLEDGPSPLPWGWGPNSQFQRIAPGPNGQYSQLQNWGSGGQ
jgi:hypothetical protein